MRRPSGRARGCGRDPLTAALVAGSLRTPATIGAATTTTFEEAAMQTLTPYFTTFGKDVAPATKSRHVAERQLKKAERRHK